MLVSSESSNRHRWERSQRANAVSIASASAANVCDRAAAKIRPGRGHSVRPAPSISSTRIDSHVLATRGSLTRRSAETARVLSGLSAVSAVLRRSGRSGAYAYAMPSQISEAQSEILHEQIVPAFVAMLDDASPLEDPAELEQLAATVLVPLEQPEMPEEVGSAVVEAIEARRDADAAGVLAALAVLAAEPLAAQAHASAERLAADGDRLAGRRRARDARRRGGGADRGRGG